MLDHSLRSFLDPGSFATLIVGLLRFRIAALPDVTARVAFTRVLD